MECLKAIKSEEAKQKGEKKQNKKIHYTGHNLSNEFINKINKKKTTINSSIFKVILLCLQVQKTDLVLLGVLSVSSTWG